MDPRQLQGHPATGRPRHSGVTLLLMVMVFSIVTINHMMVNGAEEIRRIPVISCAPFGSSAVPSLVLQPCASRSLPSFRATGSCQCRSLLSCTARLRGACRDVNE